MKTIVTENQKGFEIVEGNIVTEVGASKFYVPISKEAKEKNLSIDDLTLQPLYRNCLASVKKPNSKEFALVKFASDEEIATIKLENCYLVTPIIQDKKLEEGVHVVAFGIELEQGAKINILLAGKNKAIIDVDNDSIQYRDLKIVPKKPNKRLKAKTIIHLPKNVYVTDDSKNDRQKGLISIDYRDLTSRNSVIDSKRAELIKIKEGIDVQSIKNVIRNKRVKFNF